MELVEEDVHSAEEEADVSAAAAADGEDGPLHPRNNRKRRPPNHFLKKWTRCNAKTMN
jgi:hypothetical protein